eukprot:4237953-Pleurochrysis_carterae.AAC.4
MSQTTERGAESAAEGAERTGLDLDRSDLSDMQDFFTCPRKPRDFHSKTPPPPPNPQHHHPFRTPSHPWTVLMHPAAASKCSLAARRPPSTAPRACAVAPKKA